MRMVQRLLVLWLSLSCSWLSAGDWDQWRGGGRNGVDAESPPLLSRLPDDGLTPIWTSEAEIPSARSGGWASPVVAGGAAYLFTHQRVLREGADPPKKKFPWLAPEKRTGMTAQEYAEYEVNRRNEDEQLGRFYQYAEVLYRVDAATGKTQWINREDSVYTRFLQSGTPAVADGRLHVLGAGLHARAIDAESGKTVWKTQLPGDFRDEYLQSSFIVDGGTAVVFARKLYGLDAETGAIRWQVGEDDSRSLHTSPVLWAGPGETTVVCNFPGGETVGVSLQTGEEQWRVDSQAGHSTPLIVGDRMITYGSSRKGGLRCYQLTAGAAPQHLWTYTGAADSGSSPVALGDYVYVQGERRLACVALADGKAAWMTTLDLNRPRYTSLIAADGKLFYAHDGILCVAADSDAFQTLYHAKVDGDGLMADREVFRKRLGMDRLEQSAAGQAEAERLWQKTFSGGGPLTCATPALVDGKLFLRCKQRLVCYDLGASGR